MRSNGNEQSGGKRLLTVKSVAGMLAISPRGVWRLVAGGELPAPVKVGRCTRFFEAEIEAFLNSLRNRKEGRA